MKLVAARKRPTGFYFKVLVNDTEQEESQRIYEEKSWGIAPPAGVSPGQYLQDMKAQLKADLSAKYGPQPPETTLPGEGSNL